MEKNEIELKTYGEIVRLNAYKGKTVELYFKSANSYPEVDLTPNEARELAKELIRFAKKIEKEAN